MKTEYIYNGYVARDEDKSLHLFFTEPTKRVYEVSQGEWDNDMWDGFTLSKDDFQDVKWDDAKAQRVVIVIKKEIKMAKWKDEELKKDILELEAKNDVLKSCLRDAKNEIERLRHKIVELLNEKKLNMKTIDCDKPAQKDGGEKINLCGECKWFAIDAMGGYICTRGEWGNRKASPFVGACFNYFERKEEEK